MNIVVVDIGGTRVKYGCLDDKGILRGLSSCDTPQDSSASLLSLLCEIYRSFPEAEGLSVSIPGILDVENGVCKTGGALEYNAGLPIRDLLMQRIGAPVAIENDGRCAVMAECWKGALEGKECGVVIGLGTAVACGVVIHGRVLCGAHYTAGELSYLCSDLSRWDKPDGTAGTSLSAVKMLQAIRDALPERELPDGQAVFALLEQEEPTAKAIFDAYIQRLAVQLYNLQLLLDPEIIALGGGISRQPLLLSSLRDACNAVYEHGYWTRNTPHLPRINLVNCKFYNEANLYGAFYNYITQYPQGGKV